MRKILGLLLCLLWSAPASAATYYVATSGSSPAGSNANAGSLGAPWLTIGYAMSHVACGDIILIRAGTYAALNNQTTPVTSCASFAAAVTVRAYPSEAVHIPTFNLYTERYIIYENLILDGAPSGALQDTISICGGCSPQGSGGGYNRFLNLDVHGMNGTALHDSGNTTIVSINPGGVGHNEFIGGKYHDCYGPEFGGADPEATCHGIYMSTNNNLVDGAELYNMNAYAIHIYNFTGPGLVNPSNNIIRNNYIHNTGKRDVTVFALAIVVGDDNQAYNNIIAFSTAGISIQAQALRALVYNNTVYGVGTAGSGAALSTKGCGTQCYPAISINPGATNTIVRNNIAYGNNSDSVDNSGTGSTINSNVTSNPSFVNAGGSFLLKTDFRIPASGPAYQTGADLSAVFTSDTAGGTRVVPWDIGAYAVLTDIPGAGCATSADDFAGTGSLGISWARMKDAANATAARVNGVAVATTTGIDIAYACTSATRTANQWSEVILDSTISATTQAASTVRASGSTDTTWTLYGGYVDAGHWYIFKIVNGASTLLRSGTGTFIANDAIRTRIVGQLITMNQNGTPITGASVSDSAITAANPAGMAFYTDSGSTGIRAWSSGDEAATPDPNPPAGNSPLSRTRLHR